MIVELTIKTPGSDLNCTKKILKVVRNAKGPQKSYPLTPSVVCIEGEWDDVMTLVRHCHEEIRRQSAHVHTKLDIIDEGLIEELS
jgi:uncharacterized protein YqgV (UPF0045/DUF77 family)